MRLIRSTGQNVSPSDDGRLFDQIFTDGLFADTTFAMLGANNVQIGTIYGDLCGRDFTIEHQTVAVALPEGEGETTGYIFVEIDTSAETPLSVGSALAPFTPTYEDVNVNGAVAQMIIAEYTASPVAVTSITAKYSRVSTGGIGSLAMIESSPATANHSAGSYLVYDGVLYKVRSAIAAGETLVPGTNITATTAGAELTSLNNGLTRIKRKNQRATSNSNGVISLASILPAETTFPLSILVKDEDGATGITPFLTVEGTSYYLFLRDASTMNKVANRNVTLFIFYYDYA